MDNNFLSQRYGIGQEKKEDEQNLPSTQSYGGDQAPGGSINEILSTRYGISEAAKEKEKSQDAYAQKVEAFKPKFEERAKGGLDSVLNAPGFKESLPPIGQGLLSILPATGGIPRNPLPVIGPAFDTGMAHLEAAFGGGSEGPGGEKAKSYKERVENIKAETEAGHQVHEQLNPISSRAEEFLAPFMLPLGKGVQLVEKAIAPTTALGRVGATALGSALEGGAYAGAEAAGEKYMGTRPYAEETSVPGAAAAGALTGGLLGVAGAGVAEGLKSNFVKRIANPKDEAMTNFWKEYQAAEARGDPSFISIDDVLRGQKSGQPLRLADVGDDTTREFIAKQFEGRPKQAESLIKLANERMSGADDRIDDFLHDMMGENGQFNIDTIRRQAEEFAKNNLDTAFTNAKLPNNKVRWNRSWNSMVSDPYFQDAIAKTDKKLGYVLKNKFKSPFEIIEDAEGNKFYQLTSPDNATVHYMNQLRYELRKTARPMMASDADRDVGNVIMNMHDAIVNGMSNPRSVSYNKPFAEALNATRGFRETTNAFDLGRTFMSKLGNAQEVGRIQNLVSQMSEQEKKFFTQSVIADVSNRVFRRGGTKIDELNKLFNPKTGSRDVFEKVLGKNKVDQIETFVRSQDAIQRTAKMAADLGKGYESAYTLPNPLKVVGFFHSWKMLAAEWLAEAGQKYLNRKYASKLADMLTSEKVEDVLNAMREIDRNKTLHTNMFSDLAKALTTGVQLGGMYANQPYPVTRSTGGRIPDMDKAFKAAKKALDSHTKQMLNSDDDTIVHALRIAKELH